MLEALDFSIVDEIINKTGKGAEMAIPILQKIQEHFRYLPMGALERVCQITEITPSRLYGVATFYSQFRLEPVGEVIIKVCHGTACHVGGAATITQTLEEYLKISNGQTTVDKKYTLESVACVGCCSLAPVVLVGKDTHGKLTPVKVQETMDRYTGKSGGEK
ncbi:NADH-quinone oxidoreductase subunit NuoE [Myxococcota bacterium]|nr:NADH-quinone oxidoreductase subunit NuoE [Myxococcota bacterium]MBU1379559.1 NADH-quinone oxidoreductase subunit NuoE [Myxococcota bacterium]MBU1495277.1 NADH-quinone oxidoreductase subunit NuoE [Myxococcota bacterium]